MSNFPLLSQPAAWGPLTLPNRMFMPPMGTHTANPDGTMSNVGIEYLRERARGGCGLLITESMPFQAKYDIDTGSVVSISDDSHMDGLATAVEAVHGEGGLIAANLTPGFGRIIPVAPDGGPSWSASDNPMLADPGTRCRALSTAQVEDILDHFGRAVRRVLDAGFDGLDLHGHTGYLTDQFLSSVWNRRTDRFGGDTKGRATFATEMIRIAREIAGPDFPISMRISVRHQFPGGRTEDEARDLAVVLQDAGLDVLMVDAGAYEALDWAFPPYYLGDGVYLPDAAAVKPVLKIPVAVSGNMTPQVGEQALKDGVADFIGFGRPIIADPDLPKKVMTGNVRAVRPCIRCNEMCIGNVAAGKHVECAVNPEAGHEGVRMITPTDNPKRVVIVGGGPGGMEAARVASIRGHNVTLCEKDNALGGVLRPAATPDFKSELYKMIGWWEHELSQLDVDIQLDRAIEATDPLVDAADVVIVATGSTPWAPPIEGTDSPLAIDIIDAHLHSGLGKNVVVCGGGLSGADFALEIADGTREVTLVEMEDEIAADMVIYNRIALLTRLMTAGVNILTSHTVTKITDSSVILDGPDGTVTVDADHAVLAFGVRSNNTLQDAIPGKTVISIGDCVTPAKVSAAIHTGYQAAVSI